MRNFEMYWLTNRHHNQVKAIRRERKALIKQRTLRVFSVTGALAVVFGVLHWMALLG